MIDAALLLPKILARTGENAELAEMSVRIAWRRVVGEGLRDHAVALRLHDKILIVAVADAVWQKQLQPMSAEFIFRLNKLLRKNVVQRIEFRIDTKAIARHTKERAPVERLIAPLPSNVVSSAAEIDDPELRERFMRAAQNCISRREVRKSAI